MIPVNDTKLGATFAVRVQPRARRNAITGIVGDVLKLSLTTPPIEDRTNQACIDFFADFLGVPRSSVTIAAGATSRNKVVRISGLSAADVQKRLDMKATDLHG